jgi:hypothetical protein
MAKLTQREFFEQLQTRKKLSSSDFEYLSTFKSLHTLHLADGCEFPDNAFTALNDVCVIQLTRSYISPQNFDAMMRYESLTGLGLNDCKGIDDEEVKRIGTLVKLKGLQLAGTNISSSSLAAIGQLRVLVGLDISRTNVKGEDLHLLKSLKNLARLDISGTEVCDGDILALSVLPKLDYLLTFDTQVTGDAKDKLLIARLGVMRSPDSSTLKQVTNVLSDFFSAMATWEQDGFDEAERFSEEALLSLKRILLDYCTDRPRQDIGFGHRYGQGLGPHHNFAQLTIVACDMPSKDKALLYVKEWGRYLCHFVFVKKGSCWLIDLKKMRDDGRWKIIHPQL